jgi:hypothetical protein
VSSRERDRVLHETSAPRVPPPPRQRRPTAARPLFHLMLPGPGCREAEAACLLRLLRCCAADLSDRVVRGVHVQHTVSPPPKPGVSSTAPALRAFGLGSRTAASLNRAEADAQAMREIEFRTLPKLTNAVFPARTSEYFPIKIAVCVYLVNLLVEGTEFNFPHHLYLPGWPWSRA